MFDLSYFFTGQNETARGQAADNALANGTTLANGESYVGNNTAYAPGGQSNPVVFDDGLDYDGNPDDYAPGGTVYQSTVDANSGDTTQADADYAVVQKAQGTYATVQQDDANDAADTASYNSQVTTAAEQGAAQGANNIISWFAKLPGEIIKTIGWEWVMVALAFLFIYMGGLAMLRGSLNKKKS